MWCCSYDRSFAPNVALSVEPFDAVRKQRAAAASDDPLSGVSDDKLTAACGHRRRRLASWTAVRERAAADLDEDLDDEDDRESVSSDKRESSSFKPCLHYDVTTGMLSLVQYKTLTHSAQSNNMRTLTKRFDARLANRPF